jgi:hypothetical protein
VRLRDLGNIILQCPDDAVLVVQHLFQLAVDLERMAHVTKVVTDRIP